MPATATLSKTLGGTKLMLWNDGESLTHNDLLHAQDLNQLVAIDWQLYQKMALSAAYRLDSDVETHLRDAVDLSLRAFTFGGGALFDTSGATTSRIRGGLIATYVNAGRPLPSATVADPDTATRLSGIRMYWIPEQSSSADGDSVPVTFSHTPNPGATDRIDAVTIKITEDIANTDDHVSRDFKDATTGAITSTLMYKRRRSVAVLSMYEGIDMSVSGSLPADEHLLYTVTMPAANGNIASLCDWTHPIGRRLINYTPPVSCSSGAWDAGLSAGTGPITIGNNLHVPYGSIRQAAGSLIQYIYPPGGGDPGSRLLGFQLSYTLYTGAQVQLVRLGAGETVLADLTSLLTITPTGSAMAVHRMIVDCSGDPRPENFNGGYTGTLPAFAGSNGVSRQPIWMHGDYKRAFNLPVDGSGNPYTIALKVTSGTGDGLSLQYNAIYGVQWVVAQG